MCEHPECQHSLGPDSHCDACDREYPVLTVDMIRECELQLMAAPQIHIWPGRIIVFQYPDNLGGYPDRCVHARALDAYCESCRRM